MKPNIFNSGNNDDNGTTCISKGKLSLFLLQIYNGTDDKYKCGNILYLLANVTEM